MRSFIYWFPVLILALTACETTPAVAEVKPSSSSPTATAIVEPAAFDDLTPTKTTLLPSPTAITTPRPPTPTPAPTATPLPAVRQITPDDCCTGIYWSGDSTEVRFIDRPSTGDLVGVWGVDVTQLGAAPRLVTERLGRYNRDGALLAYPDREQGVVIVERLADGAQWQIDTQGSSVSFTADDRLLWTVYDSEVQWRARQGEIWLAEADGAKARKLITLQRGGPVAWLSETELLIASRVPPAQETLLSVLSIEDGALSDLIQLPGFRDMSFSPDGRYLLYLVRFEADMEKKGLWLLDLQASALKPEPLPFFGSYRWRDNQRLIYLPFDPAATQHIFHEYDILTGKSRPLFPEGQEPNADLIIANNDWQVSPDGSKIAFVAAKGTDLDGIWVIEMGEE